ncbi:MAG: hypothetical protein FJ288_02190 [Planctomycetes bacterium]|nr:hypothetical protein [Planctomycetota bacterium]
MNQPALIPDLHTVANGDAALGHPRLILPKVLEKAALDHRLPPDQEKAAHQVMRRWADLESRGKLRPEKETTLQWQFLMEVFCGALGYSHLSQDSALTEWDFASPWPLAGGEADAAIGRFWKEGSDPPRALVELKGPLVDLGRDRFKGRTAVDQLFDYLIAAPECPWGIACNYVGFRLYHRRKTKQAFEHFTLQGVADNVGEFRKFVILFGRLGMLGVTRAQRPLLDRLLEESENRQRQVGDDLYRYYADQRRQLIEALTRPPHAKPLDDAIRLAQKIIDRIIFIAFCEDRNLLPENAIARAWKQLPAFTKVRNPRWQNFLALFHFVDKGDPDQGIPPYDGGLFRDEPDLNVAAVDLEDRHTAFFRGVGEYDFRDEVNVEVLGHLFERSVNDLGRLRAGGLFGERAGAAAEAPRMEKSADRKRGGIYYTPPELTDLIVRETVGEAIAERLADVARRHGVDPAEAERPAAPDARLAAYWRDCFEALRTIKVCDPACGSGAFLIRAYDALAEKYKEAAGHWAWHDPAGAGADDERVPDLILADNLYGADLSPEAAEITQLALWIRSARPGKTLADLSRNIVCGNSLVSDAAADRRALDWRQAFRQVFERQEGGFDCVIGNPPWERMKLQEREFFDVAAPEIAAAVSAATRRKLIARLQKANPDLYARYAAARESAERTLDYVRTCGRFPLAGRGDVNTYAVFAELARSLVAPRGRVGLLVPSGIATDVTTKDFFAALVDAGSLRALYDFENKAPFFPDVDKRFKFSVLLFGGEKLRHRSADFVFFARRMKDLRDKDRHIVLATDDLRLLNPNTRTCPIFRTRRDAELTKAVYRRVPILVDYSRKKGGNPWGVRFVRMFDQTNDAELFHTAGDLAKQGFRRAGAAWKKGRHTFLPLYEAKMVQAYDHRAAGVVVDARNWMRQGQTLAATSVQHQNPEFQAIPRWWVAESEVERALGRKRPRGFLGFKDISSATNRRTMIAAAIPWSAVTNHFPLLLTNQRPRLETCLLANLNAFVYDYVVRQKLGAVTLNFFIVEQLPTLPPEAYAARCPWDRRQTLETWVSERVLKLTCTADDMRPLAQAAGMDPPVHRWNERERADLGAELDAAYFILYGIERQDAEYILSTFQGAGKAQEALFNGLTAAGRVLAAYDAMSGS